MESYGLCSYQYCKVGAPNNSQMTLLEHVTLYPEEVRHTSSALHVYHVTLIHVIYITL